MPLSEEFMFWCISGFVQPQTSEWTFCDVDQRRMITVKMDSEMPHEEQEDVVFEHFKRHYPSLEPDVVWIQVTPDGDLLSVSNDIVHDPVDQMYYPSPQLIERPEGVQTILRSELRELDRFVGGVDLVSYPVEGAPEATKKAVFKYYWQPQFIEKRWDEMNLWQRLSHHPNIVPFDRLVLDEVRGGVVGFTSVYIPGGTLQDNVSRPFKLKWCAQLMQLVDDLNLRYGVTHQDIVPRNLLVDETTGNILLFDFNWAAQIGRDRGLSFFSYWDIRDDVRAVIYTIYEMITRDFHFREDDWQNLDVAVLQAMEWVPHPDVKLDHPVAEYRALLNEWLKKREEGKQVAVYTDAPQYIDWPVLEKPIMKQRSRDGQVYDLPYWSWPRRELIRRGIKVTEWQRPPQSALKPDAYLLANGTFLNQDL